MSSTASQQTQIPAPTSVAPSATSYASAAGATKKPGSTPLIATGSHPPPAVVVGSAAPPSQHAKAPSISPANGRPAITPALPTGPTVTTAPAVAHGSSGLNGGAPAHSRTSSVTITANGPNSFMNGGGPAGGAKAGGIQFGYAESPHSTPQPAASAPIPISNPNSNPRVQSPAHSPSPIPQPSASGGTKGPPKMDPPQMQFGSLGADGERFTRPASMSQHPNIALGSQMQPQAHARRDSHNNEMPGHVGHGNNRGGYPPQGGRGRGGFNSQYGNQPMGFPPNGNQFAPRGPGQGRGGMQPQYAGRGAMQQYPNSPQPNRASPAIPPSMPNPSTPNMGNAIPMQHPHAGYNHQYAPPPMGNMGQMGFPPQNYPYPQVDHLGRPIQMGYAQYPGQMPFMNPPPQSPSPAAFPHSYGGGQYQPPQPQPMSRNPSQVSSDRPASSTGQNQAPVVAVGTPQPAKAPVVVASSSFVKPTRKNAAITIKNDKGEALDLTNIKAPASPASSIQQSKTPPVIASTPTPPPKPSTPLSHARTESTVTSKTAEQLRNEFKEQVRKTTAAPSDEKPKDEETARAADEQDPAEEPAKDDKELVPEETAPKAEERAPAEEVKPIDQIDAPAPAEPKIEVEKTPAAPADSVPVVSVEEDAKKAEESANVDEEDELERIIREMEEEDARREQEQAAITAKKKLEAEEVKKKAEVDRVANAAENDRLLREQEREMERIEEERERKREAGEQSKSVSELLAEKITGLTASEKKDSAAATPDSVADKMAALSVENADEPSTPSQETSGAKPSAAEKRGKPAALNLAPLKTNAVEAPQPSAALQSLKSSRFLQVNEDIRYPVGINSPNPALNAAVAKKGKAFKYDSAFLLQFQKVFTEQPSLEFHQQVKALIGDGDGSRSASARTPGGAGPGRQNPRAGGGVSTFSMGTFGAPSAVKPMQPGGSERFNNSQRIPMNAIGSFSQPNRSFPPGNPMTRQPSVTMPMPNSPRTSSKRGGSKRDNFSKNEEKNNKMMPLTMGMDVKPITISATGWKPISVGSKPQAQAPAVGQAAGHLDPEVVQRKVKAALNKMTPEKFDKIADQILVIASQSKDEQDGRTLRQVIQLTFEKATDEAHWASMYAKFCKRMLETMSSDIRDVTIVDKQGSVVSGGALFRKYLLNRCQEEFEKGWKTDLPPPKEGEEEKNPSKEVMLSDEYYAAAAVKRRGLGLVQFIGELYKLGMLTERIMHECVRKLVDYNGVPDEAEIESLSKLLRTIGANLDNTEKGKPMMDAYFVRIQNIIDMPELPSRLKFMLMDVVDLRRVGWASKEANKGPKTLEEIRADAEQQAAAKAAENARNSQRGQPGGSRGQLNRSDSRNFSGYNQPAPNQVQMDDLRRLKGTASRTASQNVTLGPTSMFSSRSNSGRRLGPGGSLGRAGEDSGASSRTGTPPMKADRDSISHQNAFGALANMDGDLNPASPPSTAASPSLAKVALDPAASEDKKESE